MSFVAPFRRFVENTHNNNKLKWKWAWFGRDVYVEYIDSLWVNQRKKKTTMFSE